MKDAKGASANDGRIRISPLAFNADASYRRKIVSYDGASRPNACFVTRLSPRPLLGSHSASKLFVGKLRDAMHGERAKPAPIRVISVACIDIFV